MSERSSVTEHDVEVYREVLKEGLPTSSELLEELDKLLSRARALDDETLRVRLFAAHSRTRSLGEKGLRAASAEDREEYEKLLSEKAEAIEQLEALRRGLDIRSNQLRKLAGNSGDFAFLSLEEKKSTWSCYEKLGAVARHLVHLLSFLLLFRLPRRLSSSNARGRGNASGSGLKAKFAAFFEESHPDSHGEESQQSEEEHNLRLCWQAFKDIEKSCRDRLKILRSFDEAKSFVEDNSAEQSDEIKGVPTLQNLEVLWNLKGVCLPSGEAVLSDVTRAHFERPSTSGFRG